MDLQVIDLHDKDTRLRTVVELKEILAKIIEANPRVSLYVIAQRNRSVEMLYRRLLTKATYSDPRPYTLFRAIEYAMVYWGSLKEKARGSRDLMH